jgi:D-mannonate dehydratase
VRLEMTHITIPTSITLGLHPQRDADIAQVCRCIENAGRAGLRGLNYNFLVGAAYARTPEHEGTKGRGGSTYSQFDLGRYDNSPPTQDSDGNWSNGAGPVKREEVYERARCCLPHHFVT